MSLSIWFGMYSHSLHKPHQNNVSPLKTPSLRDKLLIPSIISTATMESTQMISKPIFALPGSKDVEGFLTVTLCMVFGVFFLQAIYPFYRIWLNTIKSGRSSISARQKCEAWLFLALAAVSFIVVNWFRSGMMDVLSHLNQNIHGSEEWHNKTLVHHSCAELEDCSMLTRSVGLKSYGSRSWELWRVRRGRSSSLCIQPSRPPTRCPHILFSRRSGTTNMTLARASGTASR